MLLILRFNTLVKKKITKLNISWNFLRVFYMNSVKCHNFLPSSEHKLYFEFQVLKDDFVQKN